MLFSHRMGLKPQKALQLTAIDQELRNGLWSVAYEDVLSHYDPRQNSYAGIRSQCVVGSNLEVLFRAYWLSYFKLPTDILPNNIDLAVNTVREHFFKCGWNEVYDFVDFTVLHVPRDFKKKLISRLNFMLEREAAAYRLVNGQVTEITSDSEVAEIERAISSPLAGVRTHLETALGLLADRKNPDYRNSIKESISAVESMCRALANDPKATVGDALNVIQNKVGLHGALKAALSSLYGYTSDEDGVRHAILEEPNVTFNDAKFLLVSCSAFVNYITGKAVEANLPLK